MKSINVTKTFLPSLEAYTAYLEQIWSSGWITNNGVMVRELESRLLDVLGVPHLMYVSNGTIALQLAIKALGIGGEVITTPFSYVATTTAILWQGCRPVYVDIDPETCCIDPELIEAAITDRTEAILATHVYGFPCDVERIGQIAARHGLKVIYDAAHAFGVRLDGESLLNHGDVSTLSFHATKLFHTVEGGAVVCGDPEIAEALALLRSFGHVYDDYLSEGINGKNSELHAAMGLCNLPHLPDIIAARREVSRQYDAGLDGLPIRMPAGPEGLERNYAYYPVVFDTPSRRERVEAALRAQGIFPRRYFWPSLNQLPYVAGQPCPKSESISERVLCLPLFVGLEASVVDQIVAVLRRVHDDGSGTPSGVPAMGAE